jgi:hypothetical protein
MTGAALLKRILVAGALSLSASPALADAIDGDWCSTTEAARFSIAGPIIVTPAGTRTTGDYRRHTFSYVVPEGDPGAGQAIAMRQLNEEEILVSVDGGEAVLWRRCQVISQVGDQLRQPADRRADPCTVAFPRQIEGHAGAVSQGPAQHARAIRRDDETIGLLQGLKMRPRQAEFPGKQPVQAQADGLRDGEAQR